MTDAALGVLGTIGGTILGFSLLWLKEIKEGRSTLKIKVKYFCMEFLAINPETHKSLYEFRIEIWVRNTSTIKQTIFLPMVAFIDRSAQKFPEGTLINKFVYGPYKKLSNQIVETIDSEPKSSGVFIYNWRDEIRLTPSEAEDQWVKFMYRDFIQLLSLMFLLM